MDLPHAVTSKFVERHESPYLRCGSARLNGFRPSMEDTSAIAFSPSGGNSEDQKRIAFCAVFDGHGGPDCSDWLSEQLPIALESLINRKREHCAEDRWSFEDLELEEMALELDREYLSRGQTLSGSTATFVIVNLPDASQSSFGHEIELDVIIGNVGDSRVLLGRKGKATALTEDHRPTLRVERQRIWDAGGQLSSGGTIEAPNGAFLTMSRAFGDREFKVGSANPRKLQVIAVPQIKRIKMKPNDVLVLCSDQAACDFFGFGGEQFLLVRTSLAIDGVIRPKFRNQQIIDFVTNCLKTSTDLALAAGAVCEEAIWRGSKDNLTCILVQYTTHQHPQTPYSKTTEFIPGRFPRQKSYCFRVAYTAIAAKAGLSLAETLRLRREIVIKQLIEFASLRDDTDDGNEGNNAQAKLQFILDQDDLPPLVGKLRKEFLEFQQGVFRNLMV